MQKWPKSARPSKIGKTHRFRQEGITKTTKETFERAQIQIGRYNKNNKGNIGQKHRLRQEGIAKQITKETLGNTQIQIGGYNKNNKGNIGKGIDLDRKV